MISRACFAAALLSLLGACSSSSAPPQGGSEIPPKKDASAPSPDGAPSADDASDASAGQEAATVDGGVASGAKATAVVVGARHACALTAAGAVFCWGDNRDGQLGDGTNDQRNAPVAVTGLANPVVGIAAGDQHTCALDSTGVVMCWGSNGSGALGDGSSAAMRSKPGPVPGLTGVTSLGAGGSSTCAVTASGAAECWGANGFGQLGDGTTMNRSMPVATMGLIGGPFAGAYSLAPSADHTCVIANNGSVECAGDDTNGALGNSGNVSVPSFVSSGVTNAATAVASGTAVSCALTSDGSVQCWGFGGDGELGNGDIGASDMPVPVSNLTAVTNIAVGFHHACAVAAGAVSCWGDLAVAAALDAGFDDGGAAAQSTPVPIAGIPGTAAAVAAGGGTCALTTTGAVLCWGDNTYGQIGDGTTDPRPTPVSVVGF